MKLPRDLSGDELTGLLSRHYGYVLVRQKGSHRTLTTAIRGTEHSLTIPRHKQLRSGTLAAILSDVAEHHHATPASVRKRLFG